MRYTVSKVIVVDDHLYAGAGLVHRWLRETSRRVQRYITDAAPRRSGELKGGIAMSTTRVARRVVSGEIESTAPHTMFVLGGTAYQGRRYIYSRAGWANRAQIGRIARRVRQGGEEDRSGWYMRLRGPGPRYALRVHGQRANNFMLTGYNRAARTSPALRPMASNVIRLR